MIHLLACIAYGSFVVRQSPEADVTMLMIAFPLWVKSIGFSVLPIALLLMSSATGFALLKKMKIEMSARISRSSILLLSGAAGMAGYLIVLNIL